MNWATILKNEARFSDALDARALAAKYSVSLSAVRRAFSRLEVGGFVDRLGPGIYANKLALDLSPLDFVQTLRAKSYVSLDSALEHWGISTQSPVGLTCVTTARPYVYKARSFTISFRSISPRLFWGFTEKLTRYAKYQIAEPEKALLDWVYLSLQTGLSPDLDELDFSRLNKKKLLDYAEKFPSSVLNALLRHIALHLTAA